MSELPTVLQEPEGLRALWLLKILFGAVLVGLGALFAAVQLGSPFTRPDRRPLPARAPVTLGLVEQTLIEHGRRGERERQSALAALARYHYQNREVGAVRIPIERAIDLTLARSSEASGEP
ncbi:MAG TPA: hypothetical protein VGM29_13695 [Polyangiaceae bacterium]|jgi:hypothetical protein